MSDPIVGSALIFITIIDVGCLSALVYDHLESFFAVWHARFSRFRTGPEWRLGKMPGFSALAERINATRKPVQVIQYPPSIRFAERAGRN